MKSMTSLWTLFALIGSFGLWQCRTTSLHPLSNRTVTSIVSPERAEDAKANESANKGSIGKNTLAAEAAPMSVASPVTGPMMSLKDPRNVSKHSIHSIAMVPASSGNAPANTSSFASSMRNALQDTP